MDDNIEARIVALTGRIEKATAHYPAGAPGGKGGQFAPGGTKGGAGGGVKAKHLQAAGLKPNNDGSYSVVHTNNPLAGLRTRQKLESQGWSTKLRPNNGDGVDRFTMTHAEHGQISFSQKTRDRQPPDRNGRKMPAVPITVLIAH